MVGEIIEENKEEKLVGEIKEKWLGDRGTERGIPLTIELCLCSLLAPFTT